MPRQAVRAFGNSLVFTTTRKVDVSVLITQINNVSYGGWFKTSAMRQQRQPIFYSGNAAINGYGVYVNRDSTTYGMYILHGNVAWQQLTNNALDSTWHHIVVTRGTSTVTAYLDGIQVYSGAPAAPITPTNNTRIGSDPGVDSFFFGNLDETFHYPTVLTPAQVSGIYTAGIFPPGASFIYKFNEGSGTTAVDASGNSNNGTITGATYSNDVPAFSRTASATRPGIRNMNASLQFASIDGNAVSKASPNNFPAIGSPISMAGWFQVRNLTVTQCLAAAFNQATVTGIQFEIRGGALRVEKGGGAAIATSSVPPLSGNWFHGVYTFDGINNKLYLNGILRDANANAPAATNSITQIYCSTYNGTSEPNSGNAGQVGFWNRALNQSEVTSLFSSGAIPPGNILMWKLDEGAGVIAIDSSGNNNNGTITGTSTYVRDAPFKSRDVVNGNLVYNGDFEFVPPINVPTTAGNKWIDGTATGRGNNGTVDILGWYRTTGGAGTTSAMFDTANPRNGRASMKVSTVTAPAFTEVRGNATGYSYKGGISLLPNTTYTYTFWMKTNYVSGASNDGAYLDLLESNGAGTSVTAETISTKIQATTGWTQYSKTFTTSATTAWGHIECRIGGDTGAGTLIMDAWFDDIVLRQVNAPQRGIAA